MDFDLDRSIEVLARTPRTLEVLLDGLSDSWTRANEGPETFSPFDVVGHLIDGEETDWIPRARIILARGADLRFVPYDRFRHRARNVGRSLRSLLDEFARLRAANLELLGSCKLTARARNVNRSLSSLIEEFARCRADSLAVLHSWHLDEEQLDLPGLHPALGTVTLRQLLAAWVAHDLGHIAQVVRVMAKQYRDAVGPWVAFLPVLTDHEVPRS